MATYGTKTNRSYHNALFVRPHMTAYVCKGVRPRLAVSSPVRLFYCYGWETGTKRGSCHAAPLHVRLRQRLRNGRVAGRLARKGRIRRSAAPMGFMPSNCRGHPLPCRAAPMSAPGSTACAPRSNMRAALRASMFPIGKPRRISSRTACLLANCAGILCPFPMSPGPS